MAAIIHFIGKLNRMGDSSIDPKWEELIESHCKKLTIDTSWFVNIENYNSSTKPSFIVWRACKFSSEDRQQLNAKILGASIPVVVFSYAEKSGTPIIYERAKEISFANNASAFFTLTSDYKNFLTQLKKINVILKLGWSFG